MQNHLIIFVKNPELGKVKTRLAASIGDEQALKVYRDLLERCREEALASRAERHLFYSSAIPVKDQWELTDFKKYLQVEGDLGVKINAAFRQVFSMPEAEKVIIIGSDCYDLSAEIIESAFQALNEYDLVVGPANDGGYYLLGMKAFEPDLFLDIDWSTERVLQQTVERAKSKQLRLKKLIELVDLDTIEDLEQSGYKIKY